MCVNKKRRIDRETAANARAEAQAGVDRMPAGINVDDEEERQLNCVRTWSEANKDECVLQRIGQFGTKVDVPGDGNYCYHAVIATLKYIKRKCKGTIKELRRDI